MIEIRVKRLGMLSSPVYGKSTLRRSIMPASQCQDAIIHPWKTRAESSLKHRISKLAEVMDTKLKKGPKGPFSSFFMLPVGLADLIIAVTLI
ncbi:MAG: hypothetical protein ACNA7O_05315 [Rhodobacterales bacterium]